jgi:hypothetical protein
MENVFVIRIDAEKEEYTKISKILNLVASTELNYWEYEIKTKSDTIKQLFDIIYPNIQSLEKIGIKNENISIWLYCEYKNQCNMEFTPIEINLLSKLNVTLCISCWEK